MAITYTKTHLDKPTVSLSLVAGGNLEPNTTYYYRAITGESYLIYRGDRLSAASDVKSITTDTTNLSVKIDITHESGNPEYTYIWVAKDVDPGTGGWNDDTGSPVIVFLGDGVYLFRCTTRVKIDTFTDDGISYGWFSNLYKLASNPNYGFPALNEAAKDRLDCYDGDEGDPISFDSIYDYAVAQGWNLKETIERIELSNDYGLNQRRTYILNFNCLYFQSGAYFEDINKVIYLNTCRLNFNSTTYTGTYNSGLDLSNDGIDFILAGHGAHFGNVVCSAGSQELRFFDCEFIVRKADFSRSTAYSAGVRLNCTDWQLIDITLSSPTAYYGLNSGLEISNAAADGSCLLRRVSSYRHRYAGTFTAGNPFTVETAIFNWGSIWVRHTDANPRTFRGVELRGDGSGGRALTGSVYSDAGSKTVVTFVDSYIFDMLEIYWYATGSGFTEGSFYKFNYSLNLTVTDELGAGIAGAAVTLTNKNGDVVFSDSTNVDGLLAEKIVPKKAAFPDHTAGGHYQKSDFVFDYAPFTLTIEKQNFNSVILTADIPEPTSWKISLKPTSPNYVDRILATLGDELHAELDGDIRATIHDDQEAELDGDIRATIDDTIDGEVNQ